MCRHFLHKRVLSHSHDSRCHNNNNTNSLQIIRDAAAARAEPQLHLSMHIERLRTVFWTVPPAKHTFFNRVIQSVQSNQSSTQRVKMSSPYFFRQPFHYIRWASHEKPAIFYSIVIGSMGPVFLVVVPPIRKYFGDGPREKVPMTYPSKFLIPG